MKVGLDVSPALYGTGVSDYTRELVRRLECFVPFGYSLRRRSELRHLFPQARIYPFPPTVMHYVWNRLHILPVETLTGPIDIYHSSDWAQAPSAAPKVTTVHDLSPFLYPDQTSPQVVSAHTARMKWVVKECTSIICVSRSTQSDLHRLFPVTRSRTTVISEAAPTRFMIPPTIYSPVSAIVAIGARQPRKNIPRLISAHLKFQKKLNLPEKLIIIGEKGHQLTTDNSVQFTGHVSDQELVNYLANATCLVSPSLYEGFGLPILLAFYHQLPVACSDLPVFHETAGSAAAFFDPRNEESIAQGIASALKHHSKLINAGTSQLKKFSWQKTANETLRLYQSLI